MLIPKTVLISDSIHGTIQISQLEKKIISTQPFNRLHNIMQNSTAYLTYPSNQTKRFSHSLGTIHLGGQMIYYSIINSENPVRQKLFSQIKSEVIKILDDSESRTILNRILGKRVTILDHLDFTININDSLYNLNTPNILGKENIFIYQILYQSVRCAAILHDVGHPPFSHITENALNQTCLEIKKNSSDLNPRQTCFLEIINKAGTNQLHEKIGLDIASRLLESIVPNQVCSTADEAITTLFYWIVYRFTKSILHENTILFEDIHRVVSGAVDCDRLDYITRDLANSGFGCGKIEYDRLLSSMKLIEKEGRYGFAVSVRSLSIIEDFFQQRMRLYKYLIFHHRVVKTDYLLGQAIIKLSLDYLNKNIEEQTNSAALPLDISGLWKAIQNVYSNESYFDSLIQWDDAWLLTVLKQQFFEVYQDSSEIIKYQLEEILSNKKNYSSMIKRLDDFLEIDNEVFKIFSKNLEGILGEVGEEFKSKIEKLKNHDNVFNGLYLNRIKRDIFQVLRREDRFQEIIRAAAKSQAAAFGASECIVIFKQLRTGIEGPPFLYRDNELITLDKVSSTRQNLELDSETFPTFFIYIIENQEMDYLLFLRKLGEEIAGNLFQEMRSMFKK